MVAIENRIDYLPLNDRPRIQWPNNARVAFWVIPNVEYYEYLPLLRNVRAEIGGNPVFPHPDIHSNIRRDYGNRIGFWRLMKVMDKHNIRCTVNSNLALLEHLPEERDAMVERNWDFCCHGFYNTRQAPMGLSVDEQRVWLKEAIDTLKRTTGKQLKGLNVLGRSTEELPDLLAEQGLIYHADWFVDDQPQPIRVNKGKLVSIPYAADLNDSLLVSRNRAWELDYLLQMCKDQFDRLYEEGAENGKVMCLALHPWVTGYPWRINYVDQILSYIMSHDGVWQTTADDIAEYYIANYYDQTVAHMERIKQSQGQS
ncbi:polysaccharide deacetylase [Dehalococcoidia bacterium]|nr:polysaccharide deacetylase [Dehalococcoidia bacterium]